METAIDVTNVGKSFGDLHALKGVSFSVRKGEFLSVVGPSGCGKTTLLYLIQGFLEQTTGKIRVQGRTGFIFQNHGLLPWKTVEANILIGLENAGKNKGERENIASSLLQRIHLSSFKNHYPHQISEGMKQRVGIARCIANEPSILFMDEPFGSLDYFTRLKMQDFILKLQKETNLTIVFVTHDVDEALRLSDRIMVLSKRPGKILDTLKVNMKGKRNYMISSTKSYIRMKKKIFALISKEF